MRPVFMAPAVALATLFWSVGSAAACTTYTFGDDGFRLERGIQWAFVGTVEREERNTEIPDRPDAVVIRVERTLAGSAAGDELRIRQDGGCDEFWYRLGDRVVVAVPRYPGLVEAAPDALLRPPFTDVTNYAIAVWVIDGESVVPGSGPHSWPMIDGRRPSTLSELRAALARLPDTSANAIPVPSGPSGLPVLLVVALSAIGVAGLMVRRLGSTPHALAASRRTIRGSATARGRRGPRTRPRRGS